MKPNIGKSNMSPSSIARVITENIRENNGLSESSGFKASEMVAMLQSLIQKHGDLNIVSGLDRSGYGEPVVDVIVHDDVKDATGKAMVVFDILLDDSSLVSMGSLGIDRENDIKPPPATFMKSGKGY